MATALGATDATLTALTSGVSALDVGSPATPRDIEIPFVQIFSPGQIYDLSISATKIAGMMSLFETVKFISLSFAVEVTGKSGKLQFAADTDNSAPTSDAAWLGSTVYQRFSGNDQGDTYAEYVFPTRHPFGRELKAIAMGNDPPKFHFRFVGKTGDSASVRGKFVIQGGGTGIIPAIGLNVAIPKA